MAKTTFQLIPPELENGYKKALQSSDRYIIPAVQRKALFTSRKSKKGLSQKSLIPILAPVWQAFDSTTKTNWNNAGAVEGLTGWKEFLKDTALRLANGGIGYSTPQTDRQCNVGRIHIEAPASALQLEQLHPNTYYVQKKIRGTRSQYQPVIVVEHLFLPLTIGLSYRAALTEQSGGGYAKMYVEVYSHYQGITITTPLNLILNMDGNWHVDEATLSSVLGVVRGYTAYIKVHNCRGDLYFDNVRIEHSGQNWARDPHCNNIEQDFTKAFYQIPKNWGVDSIPDGAYYRSFFYGMM